jgi:hypothetical protein
MQLPPTPFPWWLWLLAMLWAGTLVLWQRAVLPREWQRWLGVVATVYTVLLCGAATAGWPWTFSRVMFWLAGGLAVGSALLLLRQTAVAGRRFAVWGLCCGVAGMLVQLGAELAAGLLLIVGGIFVMRLRPFDSTSPTSILHRDAWLIGVMTSLIVVAWMGSVRFAITVESQRPGPSQRFTALPSRDHLRRWLVTEPGHDSARSRETDQPVRWDWLALTGTLICIAIVACRRSPAASEKSGC